MEDQSMWKKDISFKRKPKQVTEAEVESAPVSGGQGQVSDTETGPKESVWNEQIERAAEEIKRAAEPAPVEVETQTPEAPAAEAPASVGPVQVPEPETAPKESVWKREIKREPKPEEAHLQAVTQTPEPAAPDTPVTSGHGEGSDPEPAPEQTAWKKEVSFSRKPSPEQHAGEVETGSVERVAPEPVVEPVVTEPTAEEPVVEVPAARAIVVPEDPDASRRASLLESWSAAPKAPPVHVDAVPPVSAPDAPTAGIPSAESSPAPGVVHPPVPAAELPPLKAEKVPFWKKDIAFGGKKKEPRQSKEPKQEKERRTKQPKAQKTKAPKVKADKGSKGAKRLVGLKIGASQLAAARVANNGSAELLQVAREPLDPGIVVGGELRDADALAEALKDFFAKHKLPKRGVRLGIANNRIGVRTFDIVGIEDQKQLANAVRFRAQEALPIPIDEAVLDYQVLGESVDEEGQPTRRILLVENLIVEDSLVDRDRQGLL